ncbi:TPA: restriction endonuclease subunit S [Neisseria meningitidis]
MKRQITIGEIAEINANSLTQKDMFQEIMYLDTGNITRNEIDNIQVLNVMMDKIPSRAKRKVKDKTIIYSTVRPNQEHYGFLENPGDNFIISTGFSTIDVYDENTDEKFIYYLLTQKHITDYLHTIGENSVSSYPSINPDDIANLKFAVPDLKTQQSIAAVLSALDKKIALNKQINARLEDMAKTLYDYWFVQFDFPDANGKPYKSSGGEIVFDETLKREIPKGWGSIELQSCLAKIPNTTKILNKDIKDFGKYPVVDQSQDFICGFTNDEKSILNPQDAHIIFGDHTRIVKLVNFQYARGADGTQVILSNNERMPNYLFYQIITTN